MNVMQLFTLLPYLSLLSLVLSFSEKVPSRAPNPVVKALANGMKLLKPAFVVEAKLQATLLANGVDKDSVANDIATEINSKDIVIYTYALSPFSTEAIDLLKESGYDFEVNELGAEWFLLGPETSLKRVLLADYAADGATSLPKVFVKGECIGGCAELASAIESGSLEEKMTPAKSPAAKGLFSFLQQ